MRAFFTAVLLVLGLSVLAGCGGDDKPEVSADEAKVIAAYDDAYAAFRAGDFAKTCTYYTVELVAQLIKDTDTKNCKQAFEAINENLEKAQPDPEVREAILSYGPEEAKITGNRALAKFGEPPAILKEKFPDDSNEGGTVELRKTKDGKWLIATFTAAG
jgi:ketosteroid isomerase-like protein